MPAPLLSVLDLCPILSGGTAHQSITHSLNLLARAESFGYHRYWFAEHHNSGMLACSAPELLIARAGAVTRRIRVGSGGIMLPNHAPLKVAELFRVLEAMYPGRIDLGLGRAPGTDPVTAAALRRGAPDGEEAVVRQLGELMGYFADTELSARQARRVAAMPMGTQTPELWILGSSIYGAQLAAVNGFPFAMAHHIQPEGAIEALQYYRHNFQPSDLLSAPRSMVSTHVVCADSDEEAERLAASADLALVNFRRGRTDSPLPSVDEALAYAYSPEEEMLRRYNRIRMTLGTPKRVRQALDALAAEGQVDEIMIHSFIHDQGARIRSYELIAQAFDLPQTA